MKLLQVLAIVGAFSLCPDVHADTPEQRYKQQFVVIGRSVQADVKNLTTGIVNAYDPEKTAGVAHNIVAARQRAVQQLTPRRLKSLRAKLDQMRNIKPVPKGWKEKDGWVDYYANSLESMAIAFSRVRVFDDATNEEIGTTVARVLRADRIVRSELNLK